VGGWGHAWRPRYSPWRAWPGLGPYRRLDFNSILPAELKMLFGYSTGFHTVSNVQTESQAALIWVRRSPGM